MSISFRDLSLGANSVVDSKEVGKGYWNEYTTTKPNAENYIRNALNLPWEERKYELRAKSFSGTAPDSLLEFIESFKEANKESVDSGADMFIKLIITGRSPQNSMETALAFTSQQVDFQRELLKDMHSIEGINMMVKTEQIKQEADLMTSKIPTPNVSSGLVSVAGAKKPRAKKAPASPKRGRGRPKKA